MFVTDVLERKGGNVVTVSAATDIRTAARELAQHRIGAVVVTDADGGIAGMLSERDLSRCIARDLAAGTQPVGEAMTPDVVTCSPDNDLSEVAKIMNDSEIRHIPVVDRGRLVGILSMRDVIRMRIGELEEENQTLRDIIVALD